jgi:hypothetical protein
MPPPAKPGKVGRLHPAIAGSEESLVSAAVSFRSGRILFLIGIIWRWDRPARICVAAVYLFKEET